MFPEVGLRVEEVLAHQEQRPCVLHNLFLAILSSMSVQAAQRRDSAELAEASLLGLSEQPPHKRQKSGIM